MSDFNQEIIYICVFVGPINILIPVWKTSDTASRFYHFRLFLQRSYGIHNSALSVQNTLIQGTRFSVALRKCYHPPVWYKKQQKQYTGKRVQMQGVNILQAILTLGIRHFVLSLFCRKGHRSGLYKCPSAHECFYLRRAYKDFSRAFSLMAANFPTICVHNSRRQTSLWRCCRWSRNLHGLGYSK